MKGALLAIGFIFAFTFGMTLAMNFYVEMKPYGENCPGVEAEVALGKIQHLLYQYRGGEK